MLVALRAVPLPWLPVALCATSYVVFALVMSRIVSRQYKWLIPEQFLRIVVACLFCLLPGLSEMAGNLCNLNWILFGWLALVTLKDPRQSTTATELAVGALLIVSMGTAALLIPVAAWRVYQVPREAGTRRRAWVPEAVQLAQLVVFGLFVLLLFGTDRPRDTNVAHLLVVKAWCDHLARLAWFTPWLGDRATMWLSGWSPFLVYRMGKAAFLLILPAALWRRRHDKRLQSVALVLLAGPAPSNPVKPPTRRTPVLLLVFLSLNAILAAHRFNIDAYGHEPRWQSSVHVLERSLATGCPSTVFVEQYPNPWVLTYRSSRKEPCP